MRTKVTLVLVFLNVALFFFIFKIMPHTIDSGVVEARRRILPASANDFSEIEIRTGEQSLRLVRRSQLWYLASPVEWPANPHAVSQVLNALRFTEHETAFTVESLTKNKLSLSNYGLDQPAITITLTPAEDKARPGAAQKLTLRIGNNTNTGSNIYVLSADGTRIHVVPRSLADSLAAPLSQFRSDSLFSIPEFEVRNFTIQPTATTAARTRLTREGSRWAMENPIQTRADAPAIRQALVELGGLHVGEFISQPLPPELNPGTAPALRLTLEGNSRSETLTLGPAVPGAQAGAQPSLYAVFEWKLESERKSAVFTVNLASSLLETLRAAQERFRESRLLDFELPAVSAILLRSPGHPDLSLQRLESASASEGPRWQLVFQNSGSAPSTQPADPSAISGLLERLTRLSAERYISDAPGAADLETWGFNRPERTVLLRRDGPTPELASLELASGQGATYARTGAARYIYGVDSSILTALSPEPRAWRNRTLRDLPAGARIGRVRIVAVDTGAVVLEKEFPSDTTPAAAAFPGQQPHKDPWVSLVSELRLLRAKSFLQDHFTPTLVLDGAEKPWKYRLEAEVSLQSGDGVQVQTQSLLLSERLGGTRQVAGTTELDAVFEVTQPLLDALWSILYGPLDPGPADAPTKAP